MKASPLWAGDRFQNLHPVLPNLRVIHWCTMPSIKDFICGGERRVPREPLPSMNPLEVWAKKPQSGLRITWLGHSTMLIEIDGVRILTRVRTMGTCGTSSLCAGRAEAIPTGTYLAARNAARRHRRGLARSAATICDYLHASAPWRQDRRAVRHLARRGRASGVLGGPGRADHRTRLVGVVFPAEYGGGADGRAVAAFLRTRAQRIATQRCGHRLPFVRRDTPCSSAGIRG